MVQYRDLNAPPSRMLADVVADMRASERQSKTGDAGVKDLGEAGDVVWSRPDAPEFTVSIRDIDGDLQDARGRIDEAKADSAEALVRVGGAEATVEAVQGGLDTLETVTLPGAVAELEAADSAVEQALQDARDALESDIATVRTSVDGKNAITQSVDAPPTSYDGAVGDRWERMSSMGSGGSLISNWRWNGSVWVSTIISDAVLGNVDAGKIVAGEMDGARIRAGTLYADRIVSGLSQNMVPDPGFNNGDINAARVARARGYGGADFSFSDGELAINVFGAPPANPNISMSSNNDLHAWAAYPGMRVVAEVEARAEGSAYGTLAAIIEIRARDGSVSRTIMNGGSLGYFDVQSDFAKHTWSYELPREVSGFSVVFQVDRRYTSGVITLRSPFVAAPTGTTLIEDGAVTTDKLLAGAVTAEKVTVTEALSANIVDAMSVNAKKLVVSEEAILNHATLIGQTVVDDINVQGKLIGTDGVFTGTVDFENVNVTNELLASKISGEHLYGTIVEGGEFRTTEGLSSGQFIISDDAFVFPDGLTTTPGLRFEDPSGDLVQPAGIGTWNGDLHLSGGRSSDGGDAMLTVESTGFLVDVNAGSAYDDLYDATVRATVSGVSLALRTPDPNLESYQVRVEPPVIFDGVERFGGRVDLLASRGDRTGEVLVYEDYVSMRTSNSSDTVAEVRADDREAYLWSTGSDGLGRILSVDSDGVWVKEQRDDGSGLWDHHNLTKTANDTGWISLPTYSVLSRHDNPAYRIKGGIVVFRGAISRTSGSHTSGWNEINSSLPAEIRPSSNILRAGVSSATSAMLLQVTAAGRLEFWLPSSLSGSTTVQLSPIFYPLG